MFRKLDGLAEEIQRFQPPVELWRKFIYCTSLTGSTIGSVDHMQTQGKVKELYLMYHHFYLFYSFLMIYHMGVRLALTYLFHAIILNNLVLEYSHKLIIIMFLWDNWLIEI